MLETMDVIEWDSDKWIIETDGTNQTDWAERIDGADKTYRTLGKLMVSLDWWIWLIELMEPLELMEWKEEISVSDWLVGIDGNYKTNGIDEL